MVPRHVENAIQRLTRKKDYFKSFGTLESWIESEQSAGNERLVDYDLRHFSYIYNHVITSFWREQIFVSPSFVEIAIFDAVLNATASNFLAHVAHAIHATGLTRESIVIFPLHSFGYTSKNFQIYLRRTQPYLQQADFRAYPQTNSLDQTIANIFQYLDDIKLPNRRKLSPDSIRHYYRSRSMQWLERNPVLLTKFRFSQWPLRDNVSAIMDQVRFVATKICFAKVLGTPAVLASERTPLWSTRSINNWQTRDIAHFLTVATATGSAEFLSMPAYNQDALVYEDTNLNFDINLDSRAGRRWMAEIFTAVDVVRVGFLEYRLTKHKNKAKFSRLASSLSYFRSSVRAHRAEERSVHLNTALEVLLLDENETKKRENMIRRTWNALRSMRVVKKADLELHLGGLITQRNRILHNGYRYEGQVDFGMLFKCYARLFLLLVRDIASIDSTRTNYMGSYLDTL